LFVTRREIMRRHSPNTFPAAFPVSNRFVLIGIALLLWILLAFPAGAQEISDPDSPPPARDYVSCGHFETQADAQAYFDSRELELPEVLDGDADGIACEDAFLDPDSPPPAMDYTSCGHFESQASAQEALDSGLVADPALLDGDGDGIACENAFETVAGNTEIAEPTVPAPAAVRLPKTGAGTSGSEGATPWAIAFVLTSGVALVLGHRLRRERDG
jgi:hypothetical protein